MLDGLLGRSGFSSKCKSLIKPTRTRIEVLRRRAEAKQRFLKEDLAKLLANGLDVNAYGRTEDFIGGLNMLSCYNFIDQSCEYILKQLSVMQKLGQCPEECRETVASLMFAAARFSDLPELRDLRDVFQERYGNGLECYVNQTFVEKLASKPPVVEKRIKLLQDIATEFSIQWDSKGFKQRMDKPSTLAEDQARKLGPPSVNNDNGNNIFRKNDQRSKERIEHNNGNIINGGRKEVTDIPFVGREERRPKERVEHAHEGLASKAENGGYYSKSKPESDSRNKNIPSITKDSGRSYLDRRPEAFHDDRVDRGRKERHVSRTESIKTQNNNDPLFGQDHSPLIKKTPTSYLDRRPDHLYNKNPEAISNGVEKSTGKMQEEEPVRLLKPCYNNTPLPPPYVKSNLPPPYTKPNNHREPPANPPSGNLPPENPSNSDRRKKEQERRHYQNDIAIPLPKPRSVRRKHSKSSSSHDDIGSSEDSRIVKRISSSRRKERKGLQILFDDEHYHRKDDEEEKMMDKLLLHYSKKPSVYDGKLKKKKSRSNTSKSPVDDIDEVEIIGQPVRSISLPHETEPKKVYARANSFQPDNQAPHVHPKLPDYDDLAARFAALRGR